MCGICGYVKKDKQILNSKYINDMTDVLRKRGPNDKNTYIYKNVALGHTRLSIIDVTYGTQPMTKVSENNEYTIVYNGELYNTNEIRNELISKDYNFSTKCDTEVVLTSYIEYGKKCVNHLNGIFSFAIFDKNKNTIFLARDRLGIKPLFYSLCKEDTNSTPYFVYTNYKITA